MKTILALILFFCTIGQQPKPTAHYQKLFYNSGQLKASGWVQNQQKIKYCKEYNPYGSLIAEGHYQSNEKCKYWFFYHFNGKLKGEGHYQNGQKNDWWNSYDDEGILIEKCQYKDNELHGYRVLLSAAKPYKVEMYVQGKKVKEWTNYTRFLIDHPQFLGS
jgi:antitoxin component YwqK of YwqJK toxin-antitoxin module